VEEEEEEDELGEEEEEEEEELDPPPACETPRHEPAPGQGKSGASVSLVERQYPA